MAGPRAGLRTASGTARQGLEKVTEAFHSTQPQPWVRAQLPPPDAELLPAAPAQPSLPTGPETLFKATSPRSLPSVTGLAQPPAESETAYPGHWHIDSSGDQESPHLAPSFISVLPPPTVPIPPLLSLLRERQDRGFWSEGELQPRSEMMV